MSKTLTFVAIESTADLQRRAAAVAGRLKPHANDARWVEEKNLHLTLMFLGELGDAEIADACSRAKEAAQANGPFSLRVSGVGAFPAPDRPRALWLGVSDGSEAVCRLQSDLDDGLADMATRSENRRFVPHWTLARLGKRGGPASAPLADVLTSLADYDAGEVLVDQIVVYASELRPAGPEYYALARCPLGKPAS